MKGLFDSSMQNVLRNRRNGCEEVAHQLRDDCSPFRVSSLFGNWQWSVVGPLGVVPFVLSCPIEAEKQRRGPTTTRGKSALSHVGSYVIYTFPGRA